MMTRSGGDKLQLSLVRSYPANHSSKSILIAEEATHHWPCQANHLAAGRNHFRNCSALAPGSGRAARGILEAWSQMSVRWWDNSCEVGVAAINTATAPFTAEFRNLQVVKGLD